jgi:hypothetical protein
VIRYVVALKVAFCRFDSIIHRLRSFAGRTADVAFMTIPCTPHHPGFTLLDVNRIPNPTFCVIMPVNFFGYHADLLPSANLRPRGRRSKRANDFRFRLVSRAKLNGVGVRSRSLVSAVGVLMGRI